MIASGGGGLRVERAGDRHVPGLLAFLDRAYGRGLYAGEAGVARWSWLYERFPSAVAGQPPAWVCVDDGGIVGHCGALPIEVRVADRATPMAWARDLIVDPRARGRGVGSRLMSETIAATGRCLILGEYEGIVAMYGRLGYRDRGRVPLFVKVLDPDAIVETVGLPSALRRVAARAIGLVHARPRASSPGSLDVERVERLDDGFDRLWSEIERRLGSLVVRRSSALLNWRYAEHPSRRYRFLAVSRAGELRALAVIRLGSARGLPAGQLVELHGHPSDRAARSAALAAAEAEMRAMGAVLARCTVRHGPTARALIAAGYVPSPSRTRFMAALASGSADADPVLRRRDWYLNGGDSDIDVL
ncbi:MAG: GNAT family N-acetyltransferase [Chloroflexi bacterium]|nr:GNAT family N-acetyltransferase [Chloroflexota bacterium]